MTRYFSPVPCSVFPDVLAAQAVPPGSSALVREEITAERLKEFFFPDAAEVNFYSGVHETLCQMVLEWFAEKSVLLILNGPMAQEWLTISGGCAAAVTVFDAASDSEVNLTQLAQTLNSQHFDAVLMVHTDIYTGVQLNIDHISAIVRMHQPEALIIADISGSIFNVRLSSMERLEDIYVCCSDMALGLPSGLVITAMNSRAHTRLMSHEVPEWLFNYSKQYVGRREQKLHAAAPYQLVNALNTQIDRVLLEGLDERIARARTLREMLKSWAASREFQIGAPDETAAPNVSALVLPAQFTPEPFCEYLREYGVTIIPGRSDIPNSVLIAHGNDVSEEDMAELLKTMDRFLTDYDTRRFHISLRTPFARKRKTDKDFFNAEK